jgi:integrase
MTRFCHQLSYKVKIVKEGNASVKIYECKSGDYPIFTVVHYHNGKRIRENFRKLANAKSRAHEIVVGIERGRRDVLSLTSTDRESYLAAVNALRPLGIPLHAAIEEFIAARLHLEGGESILSAVKDHATRKRKTTQKRVSEIVEELLAAKKRDGLSIRYIQSLRSHLRRLAAAFHVNISAISAGMIEDWISKLDVGPRARNNIRNSVVTLFQFAQKRGYLPKGERTEAEQVGRAKDNGGQIGILRPQDLAKLLSKADAEASLYLALGAFTGVRSAELIRLGWHDINFERGHIIVGKEKSKTATRRLLPIQPNLMQWLEPYRGCTGKIFASEHSVDRTIAFAKQHVKWPSNALRHSFASYRLAQTHDAARVALEMGNSPTMLFTSYRELADEHDAKAWFAIAPKRPKNVVAMAS